MITRKSKHEYRVSLKGLATTDLHETRDWCSNILGPGGRNKKCKWRYGWTQHNDDMFYFKTEKDALHFVLRWS